MLRRHYSGEQRRALNIIWNAAGRYDFDPPFMAFDEHGNADFYMNTVIGLAEKWLDMGKLSRFFESFATSPRANAFDEVCWLGIENCVYEKEIPERPILPALRRDRAEDFFRYRETLSRQEMMSRNMRVFTQREARFAMACGRKLPILAPWERELYEGLMLPGDLDTDGLIDRLQEILIRYFRFDDFSLGGERGRTALSEAAGNVLRRFFHREVKHVDSAVIRMAAPAEGDGHADVHSASLREKHDALRTEEDEEYIRACFGESIYGQKERRAMDNALCSGAHGDCRLWFTRGEPAKNAGAFEDAVRAAHDAAEQRRKNEAYFSSSGVLIASGIRRLSSRLQVILESFEQPLPVQARSGRLSSGRAWRLAVLDDPYVFEKPGDEVEHRLKVDLLLDASSSRLGSQEEIAAQAYILAGSLAECHVPVRVTAFRSLRGYTVLQLLKDYGEKDIRRLTAYYASGWNRDGLAIRAVADRMKAGESAGEGYVSPEHEFDGRILIVLTDAHPDDSTRMPPDEGNIFPREYDGAAAVNETAETVKALRKRGLTVCAIFLGLTGYLENLHVIYGDSCVRIQKVSQLAAGAAELLEKILREE